MDQEPEQTNDKAKRHGRNETLRERVEKSTLKEEKAANQPKGSKLKTAGSTATKPIRTAFRPLGWLLRHIIPKYFFRSAQELRQVTWPTIRESRRLTVAVIIFSVVFGVFISVLDLGLDKLFKKVILKQ